MAKARAPRVAVILALVAGLGYMIGAFGSSWAYAKLEARGNFVHVNPLKHEHGVARIAGRGITINRRTFISFSSRWCFGKCRALRDWGIITIRVLTVASVLSVLCALVLEAPASAIGGKAGRVPHNRRTVVLCVAAVHLCNAAAVVYSLTHFVLAARAAARSLARISEWIPGMLKFIPEAFFHFSFVGHVSPGAHGYVVGGAVVASLAASYLLVDAVRRAQEQERLWGWWYQCTRPRAILPPVPKRKAPWGPRRPGRVRDLAWIPRRPGRVRDSQRMLALV